MTSRLVAVLSILSLVATASDWMASSTLWRTALEDHFPRPWPRELAGQPHDQCRAGTGMRHPPPSGSPLRASRPPASQDRCPAPPVPDHCSNEGPQRDWCRSGQSALVTHAAPCALPLDNRAESARLSTRLNPPRTPTSPENRSLIAFPMQGLIALRKRAGEYSHVWRVFDAFRERKSEVSTTYDGLVGPADFCNRL
jgi:hypothetical protein